VTRREEKSLFGLRRRTVEHVCHGRVVIYVRFKDAERFAGRPAGSMPFKPGQAYLKLFSDVPREGLEMLFPNAVIRMRLLDKLVLGLPAAAGGIVIVATKLGATLFFVLGALLFYAGLSKDPVELDQGHLIGLGVGLFALAGYLVRQVSKFRSRKMRYLKGISENLYFSVFDNNAGVLHHMIGAAEEEDCKEAILAYYFLVSRGKAATAEDLDREVESWLTENHGVKVDFEVSDALAKLVRLGLATESGGRYAALPVEEAKARLDSTWDDYFSYSGGLLVA
jgi:hypothetical protein